MMRARATCLRFTTRRGAFWKSVRDTAGRVTSIVQADDAAIGLDYDNDDNLVGVTPPGKPAHKLTYTTDDQLSAYVAPGGATTQYSYDLDQAPTDVTNPDGAKPTSAYDAAGRLSAFKYMGGSVHAAYSVSTGLLARLTGPSTDSLSYSYDGSLLMSVQAQGEAPGTVSWTYDGKLRVASETIADSTISLGRDSDGLLTNAGQWRATRDATSGQILTADMPDASWTYTYTAFGEIESVKVSTGSGPLLDFAYTYDKLSRIVTTTETDGGGTPVAWGYAYDLAGRLSTVSKDGAPDSKYTYDANGNRTDHGGVVDAQDRLTSGFGAKYKYTQNGELAAKTDSAGLTEYTYDGRGALLSVALPASHSVSYGLDALGRRISRTYDGAITQRWVYRKRPADHRRSGRSGSRGLALRVRRDVPNSGVHGA